MSQILKPLAIVTIAIAILVTLTVCRERQSKQMKPDEYALDSVCPKGVKDQDWEKIKKHADPLLIDRDPNNSRRAELRQCSQDHRWAAFLEEDTLDQNEIRPGSRASINLRTSRLLLIPIMTHASDVPEWVPADRRQLMQHFLEMLTSGKAKEPIVNENDSETMWKYFQIEGASGVDHKNFLSGYYVTLFKTKSGWGFALESTD